MEARLERTSVLNEPGVLASVKRISWPAVFAGVLIAVVIQIALSLLGIGIGLSTVDPKTEENPVQGLGVGAGIWYVISSLIALFAGGWVAGRREAASCSRPSRNPLCRRPRSSTLDVSLAEWRRACGRDQLSAARAQLG